MDRRTHLGNFRGVNNIIARANTWSAYYGPLIMGLFFGLFYMAYEVMK